MHSGTVKFLAILSILSVFAASLCAQTIPGKLIAPKRVEPGLETAVKWKWRVEPSDEKDWGFQLPTPTPSPTPAATPVPTPENRPALYEVKHGDALILIGKKFGLTVAQLKAFNGLKDDKIRVGQILKIPTPVQLAAMAPPPPSSSSSSAEKEKAARILGSQSRSGDLRGIGQAQDPDLPGPRRVLSRPDCR